MSNDRNDNFTDGVCDLCNRTLFEIKQQDEGDQLEIYVIPNNWSALASYHCCTTCLNYFLRAFLNSSPLEALKAVQLKTDRIKLGKDLDALSDNLQATTKEMCLTCSIFYEEQKHPNRIVTINYCDDKNGRIRCANAMCSTCLGFYKGQKQPFDTLMM